VGLVASAILTLLTSSFLYFANNSDPRFSSIPRCMYLAILMLTGQGIPTGSLTPITQFAVGVTAIFSIAVFAIPSAMLAWGFESEAERLENNRKKKIKKKNECAKKGIPYVEESDSEESDSDDDDRDEKDSKKDSNVSSVQTTIVSLQRKPSVTRVVCIHCSGSGLVPGVPKS